MSTVTRREANPTAIMTPTLDGGYVEHTIEAAHAWRCDGCGLVWEKRWHAEACEERGHVPSFQQGPYGVKYVENGQPVGDLRYYQRSAIRREALASAQ